MESIILGGGLAGLSAGKILSKNGTSVAILEKNGIVGGLARSFTHDECTCDLGGHRFFTKEGKLVGGIKEIRDTIKQIGGGGDFFG